MSPKSIQNKIEIRFFVKTTLFALFEDFKQFNIGQLIHDCDSPETENRAYDAIKCAFIHAKVKLKLKLKLKLNRNYCIAREIPNVPSGESFHGKDITLVCQGPLSGYFSLLGSNVLECMLEKYISMYNFSKAFFRSDLAKIS